MKLCETYQDADYIVDKILMKNHRKKMLKVVPGEQQINGYPREKWWR